MRPILFDINADLDTPVRIDRPVVPLRVKLLGSLPLINVITGIVVAALTSDGGGTDALGINVLIALFVSFTDQLRADGAAHPLDPAADRGPRGGDRADPPGPLRRARARSPPRTSSASSPRRSTRWSTGSPSASGCARPSAPISTRRSPSTSSARTSTRRAHEVEVSLVFCDVQDFTTAAAEAERAGDRRPAERAVRVHRPDRRPPPRPHRPVHRRRGAGRLRRAGADPDHADRAVQCAVELARTDQQPPAGRLRGRGRGQHRARWSRGRSAAPGVSPSA